MNTALAENPLIERAGAPALEALDDRGAQRRRFLGSVGFYIGGIILALASWWAASLFLAGEFTGFRPLATFHALIALLPQEHFRTGIVQSLERLFGGLGIAAVVGVPIGIAIGSVGWLDEITYIPFQFLRMTSPLSWMPVAIIIFGVGARPVYFLIAIAAVWPLIISTAQGVHKINRAWIDVARTLGGGRWEVTRRVVWPAILPDVLTGLRIALGVSWIVIVPAEMLGVASGLGYMILDYRDVVDYASLMAVILVIGLLGYVTDLAVLLLIQHFSWEA